MNRIAILPLAASLLLLAGCAGGSGSACEVFSPPPAVSPTTQNDQRVEMQSSGDPTLQDPSAQDC